MNHAMRRPVERNHDRTIAASARAANEAERIVHDAWRSVLAILDRASLANHEWHGALVSLLRHLRGRLIYSMAQHLGDITRDTHARTASSIVFEVSPAVLRRLAIRRVFEDDSDRLTLQAILFPPPPEHLVQSIVFSSGWSQRIGFLSALADPGMMAGIVAAGVVEGKTSAQMARDLRPLLQGVQSSARRVARTEGVRVAHEVQMHAYDQLGDMVIGYQIHATKNTCPPSRQWHQDRDGTIYYKAPAPGQKGILQMPRPPMEAPDPAERPPWAPHVAPNCLCYLTPVLSSEYQIA